MGDLFYRFVRFAGLAPVVITTCRTTLHVRRVPRKGPAIVAATHLSPFDVPALIAALARPIDFVSITELMDRPAVGWFFDKMNAFPLDRSRRDPAATRVLLERLNAGRLVGMFPEGRIRPIGESVICTGRFNPVVIKIARATGAPIIPAVILGAEAMWNPAAWLPVAQTRFGLIFGTQIRVPAGADQQALTSVGNELATCYRQLAEELAARLNLPYLTHRPELIS